MRVFIVGATGLLGRAAIPSLLEGGDEVVALVRSLDRAQDIDLPGVRLYEGDLLTIEPAALTEMLQGCDAAAHLATALRRGSPGLNTTSTNAALRTAGTRRLLDAVLAAGVRRYVQQSIALAYVDGGDNWLDESTPFYRPDDASDRAAPVVEMEQMVRELDPQRVEWVILRGGSFTGPGTFQDDAIAGLRAGTLRVQGDGSNWVSFVHSDDYADAVVLATRAPVSSLILNVADEPIRNGEYLDRLADLIGVPRPERAPEAGLPRSYRCTNGAARDALGWAPKAGIWSRTSRGQRAAT